jgi:hypothetical protein
MYIPLVFRSLVWCGAVGFMCLDCGILLNWLCLVVCRGDGGWPVGKEGSARQGIVQELVCLLGGGIGCIIACKGLTCSRI